MRSLLVSDLHYRLKQFGDEALRDWVAGYAPDFVLSGHIHQSPFRAGGSWIDRLGSSWLFNAGCQIGPVPVHMILDTDASSVTWFSLAGNEEARLDADAPERVPLPS
jgi:hypothetical protein